MEHGLEKTIKTQLARIAELEKTIRRQDRIISRLEMDVKREKVYANTRANQAAAHIVALRIRDRYLQLLLDNSPDIIICLNHAGRIVFCSEAFASLVDDRAFQAEGKQIREALKSVHDREFTEAVTGNLARVLDGNETFSRMAETYVDGGMGGLRKFIVNFISMDSGEGVNEGAMLIFHDITEIVVAREKAEKASAAKSQFLSNMSHEMRTPLNAITGMVAIAMKAGDLDRKDYCLEKIDAASAHLLGLINDILDMSKIEANMMQLSLEVFSFESAIREAVNVVKAQMEDKRQNFFMNLDKNIPASIIGDSQRLVQIVTNLLSNAVKFTSGSGSVRLEAHHEGMAGGGAHTIRVEVSDTGIGIGEESRENLFSPFQQVDSGTSRKFGGTGLGLAISKRLVEMMDGHIWFESEPGEGSTFYFTFRARSGDANGSAESAPRDAGTGDFADFSALLVDDVELNREIIISLLEHTGLSINCAENGLDALEKVKAAEKPFDIIFMDLQMPVMDGYEATRQIRKLEDELEKSRQPRRRIPIVAITANVFREDVEKCLKVGMDNHIGKPVNTEDLVEKLYMYLGGWSPMC